MDHCLLHHRQDDLKLRVNSYSFTWLQSNPGRQPIKSIVGIASWADYWRRSVRLNV